MPDSLSPSERALIDAAVRAGRVNRIPRGTYTAEAYGPMRGTGRLIGRRIVRPGEPETVGPVVPRKWKDSEAKKRQRTKAGEAARRAVSDAARAKYAVVASPDLTIEEQAALLKCGAEAVRKALRKYGLPWKRLKPPPANAKRGG